MNTRTISIGRSRTVVELKNLWRSRQQLGFTVLFPVMMLLLFASIFSGRVDGTTIELSQVYVAGIIGSSLMSTGFVGLAIGLAVEREAGTLDRLAGTPMPRASYFLGKIGMVLSTVALQVVVLIGIGVALFDLSLPTDVVSWLTFVWVFLLGVSSSALLGIAVGGMIADAKSAPAVVNLPFVALQFISGVFISINLLPISLVRVSQFFPLHWICRGMRSVFLPDSFKTVEADGSWQLGMTAIVLGAWCILGFVLCARTFRWSRR